MWIAVGKQCALPVKPSVKTVSSVFHLQHVRADQELTVVLNGACLKHDSKPVYLGVTLYRTLSYREHLLIASRKLKTRINLLTELVGTSGVQTLARSDHQPCITATQLATTCAPVWAQYARTKRVDLQLKYVMRLIS